MPWPFRHGVPVTIRRMVTDPKTGDRTLTTVAVVEACGFDPGGSVEVTDGTSVTTSPRIFGPADIDVLPGDQVQVRGLIFEADGHPAVWRSPLTGREPGAVVNLSRREGA